MVQNLLMNMLLDPLNDWEELDILLMVPKIVFFMFSNLENFSNVLFDEKVLMSTEYGGPPRELEVSQLSTPTF